VTIGPGYAVDKQGREIILTHAQTLPVPPVASESNGQSVFFDLTIAYPADDDLEKVEFRRGVCQTQGAVRLREEPVFSWVRLKRQENADSTPVAMNTQIESEIAEGRRLVVARIEVLECQLAKDVSTAPRRSARPAQQPYIACGEDDVTGEPKLDKSLITIKHVVDTTAASFLATPCYSVRLVGDRVFSDATPPFVVLTTVVIREASNKSFTVEIMLLPLPLDATTGGGQASTTSLTLGDTLTLNIAPNQATSDEAKKKLAQRKWKLVWMGVED
jgi:hypothetical protein